MKSITTAQTRSIGDGNTTSAQRHLKAYSYKRFSTPAQAQGDSLRRQTAMAEAWADRKGVPLDTELMARSFATTSSFSMST